MPTKTNLNLSCPIYHDQVFECDAVRILPGQFYVTDRDVLINTVVGSCVAACIRDRATGLGGMNHFMLPDVPDYGEPYSEAARYGAYAMEILINNLMKMGAAKPNLEAKVFGGGNVLPNATTTKIGERNADFVKRYLRNEAIPIVAQDLIQNYGRRVYFFPRTGKVIVKKVLVAVSAIADGEREYGCAIKASQADKAIDLF